MEQDRHLSNDLNGGLKQLIWLLLPLLGTAFANYLFLLVEKMYLARLSFDAVEAAVNVAYVCQIFQMSTVALGMMAQVFVGRWVGAKDYQAIGPGVWQFIWFSILSMFLTVPASLFYGHWFFHGSVIEAIALPYFYLLVGINFLFPLGITLSSFFLGQGRAYLVLCGSLGAQCIKIVLAYILIFGWEDWIPSLGLIGGAISTAIAQLGFCIFLGRIFLSQHHAALFDSRNWRFRPALFWECIQPGLFRAVNRISCALCWSSIAHLMVVKGGDHLLVLSIGGTIFLFLPCLNEAVVQAQTTIVSQLLGAQNYTLIPKTLRSGWTVVAGIVFLAAIPLVIFPLQTAHFLFPGVHLQGSLQAVFFGVWVSFAFFHAASIPYSYLQSFKDMKFCLYLGFFNWVDGYLVMYLAIQTLNTPADQFWLVLSLMHATIVVVYLWRTNYLFKKIRSAIPTFSN